MAGPDPTARLQPLAEQVRRDTGTDFVVVMTVDGVRYTHPDTAQIGKHFLGTIAPAANGRADHRDLHGHAGPLGAGGRPGARRRRVRRRWWRSAARSRR